MANITDIMPLIRVRRIAEDPRAYFADLAHQLLEQTLPLILTGHTTLAARVKDAAEKARRLSRARRLDPDQLQALADAMHGLVAEGEALTALHSDNLDSRSNCRG